MKLRFVLICLMLLPAELLAQRATINGTVVNEYGEPLAGVNVSLAEMLFGTSTDEAGQYLLSIPSSLSDGRVVTLEVAAAGYFIAAKTIALNRGIQTHDFLLEPDLLLLDELVVTGLAATSRKELTYGVSQADIETLQQAPGSDPLTSLQGKVAGLYTTPNSGAPGDALSVQLRGLTTITGNSQPLFILDGVLLAADQLDLNVLDVEEIEVLKGPAAAAQYGSRARAGAIQIRTRRGASLPINQFRVTLRNAFGLHDLAHTPGVNQSHNFLLSESGAFLDGAGNEIAYGPGLVPDREFSGVTFYDNTFADAAFNAFDQFFNPASTWSNYIAIGRNGAAANFHASFSNMGEAGIVTGLDGYRRLSGRLNADYRILPSLMLSASGTISRSDNDTPMLSRPASMLATRYNPFVGLQATTPLSNLAQRDAAGELLPLADLLALDPNPRYVLENTRFNNERNRMLGRAGLHFLPVTWLELNASMGYDRLEQDQRATYTTGLVQLETGSENNGLGQRIDGLQEALNYDAGVIFRKSFAGLALRSEWQYRHEDFEAVQSLYQGNGASNLQNGQLIASGQTARVLSDSWLGALGLDYQRKVFAEATVLREGNSLFGAEERWQHYYRFSGSYRISEEDWWSLRRGIPEFKLYAAYGTAGGRPRYNAQFASVQTIGGELVKQTLGNRALKPEHTAEFEAGLDMAIGGRVRLDAVYALGNTDDLLLEVPLPGFLGYQTQWQNAGALESHTLEVGLHASLIKTRNASLEIGVLFDRTRQHITALRHGEFLGGPYEAFLFRVDEAPGTLFGASFLTDPDGLPAGADPGFFDVNDEGYVVAVGEGNTYRDGIEKQLWGSTVAVAGASYPWGIPLKEDDASGDGRRAIGSVVPDFNLGVPVRFSIRGFTAYMLWNARVGGDIYNFTNQASYLSGRSADQDQAGKVDALKKPAGYYDVLYDAGAINAHFVEDGSYVRLREVALSYTFGADGAVGLPGDFIDRLTVRLVGRNLFTSTRYSGFDPEVGTTFNAQGAVTPAATLYRVDNFGYPLYRTFSGVLEIQF